MMGNHELTLIDNRFALLAVLALALAASCLGQNGEPVTLNFQGLQDGQAVLNFFDGGGSGQFYGIDFQNAAVASVALSAGGNGAFAGNPSGSDTVLAFNNNPGDVMNVNVGFTKGLTLYYASVGSGTITIYDGQNATGNVLATLDLGGTGGYCNGSAFYYSCWDVASASFGGVAKSVDFSQARSQFFFDDITILSLGTPPPPTGPILSITQFVSGSTVTTSPGTTSQPVSVTNSGAAGSFTASIQSNFSGAFSIEPTSGVIGASGTSGSATSLSVSFNSTNLPPGVYVATYTVTPQNASARKGSGPDASKDAAPRSAAPPAMGMAQFTNNGVLLVSEHNLTYNLSGSQQQSQTITVTEETGAVIPINAAYSGQTGPVAVVNSPSDTPDLVTLGISSGTLASGGNALGALTLTCTTSQPCSNTPINVAVSISEGTASAITRSLPHFAAGGSFVSDFYVVNTGTAAANFTIAFHDDGGNAVAVPIIGMGSVATLSNSIPAGGAAFYEAGTPQGTLVSGSALITSDPSITVQALFRRLGSDGSYYEAAVPEAMGTNEIQIPFDDTTFAANGDQIYTGLAIANLDTSNSANVACVARDSTGDVISDAVSTPLLNPLGHWAGYLFPDLVGLRGTLDCTSNTQIGAIGIRALGADALSSVPVVSLPASFFAQELLPHFAAGESFVTDFYVVNGSGVAGNFSITFHDDGGNPIAVPFAGLGSLTMLSDSIPAGGAGFYETTSPEGALFSGSAIISADNGVAVQALFRRLGSDGSYYEAAVPPATGSTEVQVPFDDTVFAADGSQIYTGLAIANLDSGTTANVSCVARDSTGTVIPDAVPSQSLNPLGHWAGYLFPPLAGLRGTLACTSNTQIGAIGIRSLGANALSSLPVIATTP